MRRIEKFILFSALIAAILFLTMPTPPALYFSLIYLLLLWASRNNIKEKPIRWGVTTLAGVLMILGSPLFLIFKWGGYPSPSTFQALLYLGISLIAFEVRTIAFPSLLLLLEVFLSAVSRTTLGVTLLVWTSDRFVDVTSYLVRGLIDVFDVPITMTDNVATVRNTAVIIGSGCSGLDAFILYLLASLLLIYLRKSGRREAALILLGALGIIPLNAVRIFILLLIGYHSGIPFLELFHSHLGDLMFLAYVILYWWWVLKDTRKPSP